MERPYFWTNNSTPSQDDSWKNTASTLSMNSLSFCFLATAILILMFLVMAIFERILRASQHHESPPTFPQGDSGFHEEEHHIHSAKKIDSSQHVADSNTFDFSVMMPGQLCPTHLARPAPLPSLPREGIHWPTHAPHALASA
ncbi:hypothetical protein Cni_G11095 [Canna indica]|uniref:Uncharacterized protein n=1 Tax=Canna indica TaxID=4628 RepID=A0AAQ3Q7V5_9LILI|nr:hypothetical protein Cni_G11095 [Canna indica]